MPKSEIEIELDELKRVMRAILNDVFESEIAGHIKHETLLRAADLINYYSPTINNNRKHNAES